jgi:hypothetical protein
MSNKTALTQQLLEQLPQAEQCSLAMALKDWWWTDRSWRLTNQGLKIFEQSGIEKYAYDVPASTPFIPKNLLALDRKLANPYFLKLGKKPQIIFYGSKDATIFALYGDVGRFINMLCAQ